MTKLECSVLEYLSLGSGSPSDNSPLATVIWSRSWRTALVAVLTTNRHALNVPRTLRRMAQVCQIGSTTTLISLDSETLRLADMRRSEWMSKTSPRQHSIGLC